MSKRIDAIEKYIESEDKVVDVGCDHAILGEILAKRNIPSIASDVNSGIIERRKKENHSELITFMVSDGLKDIDQNLYDTVVIAGMGTKTILDIVKSSPRKFRKLITVSNNDYFELRKGMHELGFKIVLEEVIEERGKFYNLILFNKGQRSLSYVDLVLGVSHVNKETYRRKNEYLYNKYMDILCKLPEKQYYRKYQIRELLKDIKHGMK